MKMEEVLSPEPTNKPNALYDAQTERQPSFPQQEPRKPGTLQLSLCYK
jgi:hypothetical protein